MYEKNKEIVRLFFKGLGAADTALLADVLSKDVKAIATGTSVMSGTRSYDDIMGTAHILLKACPKGIEFQELNLTAEDNRVSAEMQGIATLANGKPYNNQYHFLFTIRDGKIVEFKEYFCTKLVEAELVPVISGA